MVFGRHVEELILKIIIIFELFQQGLFTMIKDPV